MKNYVYSKYRNVELCATVRTGMKSGDSELAHRVRVILVGSHHDGQIRPAGIHFTLPASGRPVRHESHSRISVATSLARFQVLLPALAGVRRANLEARY